MLTDMDGNRFADLAGCRDDERRAHSDERVLGAAREQLGRLVHTDYTVAPYGIYAEVAERLVRLVEGARKAAFFNSGAGANPYHRDAAFAEQSFYGRLTIPGLLTGSMLTHIGDLLGFLATEMSFEYLAPVFVGDTISCTVTISEKDEEKRRVKATAGFVNQDDVEVLRAMFAGFPGWIRLVR